MIISICYCFKLEEGRPLPSPNQLRGRILIKNKKLKPEQEAEGETSYGNAYLYVGKLSMMCGRYIASLYLPVVVSCLS